MDNYVGNSGQNLFDVALNTIGDLNKLYSIIPSGGNITTDPTGVNFSYVPSPSTPPVITSTLNPSPITSQVFLSVPNQSVFDICLQTYGDLNLTYKLIFDSGFTGVSAYPAPNYNFVYNPQLVFDASFAYYLSKNKIVINSAQPILYLTSGGLETDDGIQILTDDGVNIIVD